MTVTDSGVGGGPLLELGTGNQIFEPLTNGQGLTIIAGPQGGFHLWAAARISPPDDFIISTWPRKPASASRVSSRAR